MLRRNSGAALRSISLFSKSGGISASSVWPWPFLRQDREDAVVLAVGENELAPFVELVFANGGVLLLSVEGREAVYFGERKHGVLMLVVTLEWCLTYVLVW